MVIFRGADGRTLTLDELRGITGTIRYEVVCKFNVPAEPKSLHQQARLAGQSGDYKKAIGLLEQASNLAPQWPYPVYDTAFTHLLIKDTESARKYYRKTVDLSPRGFFAAITAIDTLDREKRGDLPAGTYVAYLSLSGRTIPTKGLESCTNWSNGFRVLRPVGKNSRPFRKTTLKNSWPPSVGWQRTPTVKRGVFWRLTGP